MIGNLTGYGMNPFSSYGYQAQLSGAKSRAEQIAASVANTANPTQKAQDVDGARAVKNPGESTQVQPGKKSSPAECQTCKERKYQDGSDEMVSFKSAAHVSPNAASSAVRAHEQEHVSNAYKKAEQNNGKVLQASVKIKTAICPECGRSYVSGGTTTTQIKYSDEKNPYQQNKKAMDAQALKGANVNLAG